MIPKFCLLTTLSGAPHNLKSWGGQTCTSKLTIQKRWDNRCWKEARTEKCPEQYCIARVTAGAEYRAQVSQPAIWSIQTAPPETTFFSLWHKTPILGMIGRGGSKTITSPSRIPAALFPVGSHPPLWSPAAAPGRLQGAHCSINAETGKVPKRNGE